MSEIQKKSSMQKTPVPPPEERLLLRFSWCCKQYRENTNENAFLSAGQPTAWLVGKGNDMTPSDSIDWPQNTTSTGLTEQTADKPGTQNDAADTSGGVCPESSVSSV